MSGKFLAGYALGKAEGADSTPAVEQATPSISVSSGGLITASATQSAGKVAAGTKSATQQLTAQAAKTVTPGTTDQVAVASGRYTTGEVQVAGDANFLAENIKKDVTMFGKTGTYEGSGGGADAAYSVKAYRQSTLILHPYLNQNYAPPFMPTRVAVTLCDEAGQTDINDDGAVNSVIESSAGVYEMTVMEGGACVVYQAQVSLNTATGDVTLIASYPGLHFFNTDYRISYYR